MVKKKPAATAKTKEVEALRKSLLSIGVEKGSAGKLVASGALDRVVVPLYWKDGIVLHANRLALSKLPNFLKGFEEEFPDGEVRWDPDYYEQNLPDNSSNVAIRIIFNLQEDDQGDHWSPRPTVIEEKSYERMLKRCSYKGSRPVQAQAILHAG